jgi:hypothetical protein
VSTLLGLLRPDSMLIDFIRMQSKRIMIGREITLSFNDSVKQFENVHVFSDGQRGGGL